MTRLIASLLAASALTGGTVLARNIDVSTSCSERSQGYATCPLNPADHAVVTGWPMPSSGGRVQLFKAALTHMLSRHNARVVEVLARICDTGHFRLVKQGWHPKAPTTTLAAAQA
jgi:hypothetical protein